MKKLISLALVLSLGPATAGAQVVEYYHLDAIGNVRAVTDSARQVVERHDYLPYGEECTTGPCASNPALGAGQPKKFTGKERDAETGLDYFGARYYGSKLGRFTTVDPYLDQSAAIVDPQRWNRYGYGRANPLKYVDPDGRDVETQQEVFQAWHEYQSGQITFQQYQAQLSGIGESGLVGVALLIPGPEEFAIAALTARFGGILGRFLGWATRVGDDVADTAKVARGGENAAAKAGREAHAKFAEKVRAKADKGWQSEPRIKGPHGETLQPDALTPSGRPVELKPNTPSGRRRGAAQLKKYEEATGKKGRVVYHHDPPK